MQHEITEPGPLLDAAGRLVEPGWARRPHWVYDRSRARGRLKEWDYYWVLEPDFGLALTVTDLGVMGLLSVVWLDFRARSFHSSDAMRPFTRGRMALPASALEGDVQVTWGKRTASIEKRAGERILHLDWPRFRAGEQLTAEISLRGSDDDDAIAVATPFEEHATGFYYNHKISGLLAEGDVRIGDTVHRFEPDRALGGLDWGRGVWPYSVVWYWGAAAALVDGRRISWNIGYGFGDLSTHSENIAFVDGVGHKLGRVTFEFDGWLEPWRFTSDDGRFEMTFEPLLDRNGDVNLLIFRSVQHQVFGHYSGRITLDDGEVLALDRVLGFAEEVRNRW